MNLRRTSRSHRLVAGAILAALTCAGCTSAPSDPGAPVEEFASSLETRIAEMMHRFDIPGVGVALIRDADVVWTGAFGVENVESLRPIGAETIFRLESISKPVTAWAVMRLADDGVIGLDEPVPGDLVPGMSGDSVQVTLRDLLSNSAGLPLGTLGLEYPPGSDMPSLDEYLADEVRFVRPPGSAFVYSNVGFAVVEKFLESRTGMEFDSLMDRQVFQPLEMTKATFSATRHVRDRAATGYDLGGRPVDLYVYPASASGGMFGTLEDVARFVAADTWRDPPSREEGLHPESVRIMHRPQIHIGGAYGLVADAYGLGHFVETLPGGRVAVWHGGQGHGWMSHFHVVPASGDGLVILTNSQRSWPLFAAVLSDWARWTGMESVRMGGIRHLVTAARSLNWILSLVILWIPVRLALGIRYGTVRFDPSFRYRRNRRILSVVAAAGLIGAIAWYSTRPYVMIASILPGIIGTTAISGTILAVLLVVRGLFSFTDADASPGHLTPRPSSRRRA